MRAMSAFRRCVCCRKSPPACRPTANVEQLLGRFLSTMIRLAGAQAGAVRVITDDRTHLRLIGSVGLPPEMVEHEAIVSVDCGVCGKAAREITTSSWNNVAFCKKQANDAYFSGSCNTVVAVPLMHKNQVMGVYNLFLDEGHTVPEDVRMLFRSIGEHLGIALENARLDPREHAHLADERTPDAGQPDSRFAGADAGLRQDAAHRPERRDAPRGLPQGQPLPRRRRRSGRSGLRRSARPHHPVPRPHQPARAGAGDPGTGQELPQKSQCRRRFPQPGAGRLAHPRRGNPGLPHHPGIALQHRQARARAPRRHHLRSRRRPVHRQRRRRRRRRATKERRIVDHGQELRPHHHARARRQARRQTQGGKPSRRRHRGTPGVPAASRQPAPSRARQPGRSL